MVGVFPFMDILFDWNIAYGSGTNPDTMNFFSAVKYGFPLFIVITGILYIYVEAQRERQAEI